MRATLIPAFTSSSTAVRDAVAGPSVQTIFVRQNKVAGRERRGLGEGGVMRSSLRREGATQLPGLLLEPRDQRIIGFLKARESIGQQLVGHRVD